MLALSQGVRDLDGIFPAGRFLLLQCLIQSCSLSDRPECMFAPKTFVREGLAALALVTV